MEAKKALAQEAGCINCRCDGRRNATSLKKSRWHVCLRCAQWRSATVRWRKKKGVTNRGCSSLRHVTGNRRRRDGARFIVPLGILHLSFLAAKLAVYATPTSNWHASTHACFYRLSPTPTLLDIVTAWFSENSCAAFAWKWNLSAGFAMVFAKNELKIITDDFVLFFLFCW